nr:ATP-binding SpoIIE family protein phosphatase [uncultured Albidiferax sp.]
MTSAGHSPGVGTALFRLHSPLDLRMAVADVANMPSLARFAPVDLSLLATVVSELGSNILKYAGSGHIRVQTTVENSRTAVELVAEDFGPGIPDVPLALQAHYSTSGTLGLGLSGVRSMVSEFQIDSAPGKGCRVRVRQWLTPPSMAHADSVRQAMAMVTHTRTHRAQDAAGKGLQFDIAEINRPCYPEHVSGDSTLVQPLQGGLLLACIDASGHGKRAHALSVQLAGFLGAATHTDLAALLHQLHLRAVGSIGAAIALAYLDLARNTLSLVGVGNIRIRCIGPMPWVGICRDGVLGERFPTPDVQHFTLQADDVLLLYSDGIREGISHEVRPRVHLGTAQQIAQTVLQVGGKTTDDASCIVVKCKT